MKLDHLFPFAALAILLFTSPARSQQALFHGVGFEAPSAAVSISATGDIVASAAPASFNPKELWTWDRDNGPLLVATTPAEAYLNSGLPRLSGDGQRLVGSIAFSDMGVTTDVWAGYWTRDGSFTQINEQPEPSVQY